MEKTFPFDVFEDVKGTDFSKHNKKHVTEDFVVENLKELSWRVYRPFNDTGIDLIATKYVCPNSHTPIDNTEKVCSICGKQGIEITRFIQVKTREVKGKETSNTQFFGYTLKPKDFRTDPRHVFLLYSDYTKDFIILPVYDYLKIFAEHEEMGKSHFGTPAFRVGNNKLNSLQRDKNGNWIWKYGRKGEYVSFNEYVNEKGIEKISNPKYELNFYEYATKTADLKFRLFYTYSRGRQVDELKEEEINVYLAEQVKENKERISIKRSQTKSKLLYELHPSLIRSIEEGYFVKFKGVSFNE